MTIRCPPYDYRHFIHADRPMRTEREAYLAHLAALGASYNYLKLVASNLLHVVQGMGIHAPRQFTKEEVILAGERWAYAGVLTITNSGSGSPTDFEFPENTVCL